MSEEETKPTGTPQESAGDQDAKPKEASGLEVVQNAAYQELEEKYGVTKAQITDWKGTFGPVDTIQIRGELYVYRGMSRPEWKKEMPVPMGMLSPEDASLREETISRKCLLFPGHDVFLQPAMAGLPTVLFVAIQRLSAFEPDTPPIPL